MPGKVKSKRLPGPMKRILIILLTAASVFCLTSAAAKTYPSGVLPLGVLTSGTHLSDILPSESLPSESLPLESMPSESLNPANAHVALDSKLACKYYNDSDFKSSVYAAELTVTDAASKAAGRVIGGVTPHHLLADRIIAGFFKTLSASNPEVVFLAGPNHKRVGSQKINTGNWDWQTPFGVLEAEDSIVENLAKAEKAGEDFDLLQDEHSVSSLVPYLKYYIPEAKVVPILLHGNLGIDGSKKLAKDIRRLAGGVDWVIVGSVDFSHYLPPETAAGMDDITLDAIKTGNFEALSRMGNDNLDSPPTVMTLLEAMKEEGAGAPVILDHSNSADIAGEWSNSTTSYFSMIFKKPAEPAEAADHSSGATALDLQGLIDNAGAAGEVEIPSGTYTISEPLAIKDKSKFTLKGDGIVRILGENIDRQIITVKDCDTVILENISACHKSSAKAKQTKVFEKRSGSVVDVDSCKKAVFNSCELEGCGVYGVYTVNTAEIEINGCFIHHNSWRAFGFHADRGVTNVTIKDSTVTNNEELFEKEGNVNILLGSGNVIKFNNDEGYKTGR